ncbi:acyl-CoA dehydrogenase family protein [Nocardioides sp. LML1-1-1.1]|uniref:acyl-CoA dehydrogenase family protein n=1 Tax=Nocardioides sp. LML1-1-1.1 TaxID=3135248 RepID=UPI00341388D2
MREFVDHEVLSLEVLQPGSTEFIARVAANQREVKAQGLWAAHLDPELGGQGFGQVKLGLMHEISGRSLYGAVCFGSQAPDSGNSEILARHATPAQRERYLYPLLTGEKRSAYVMTEQAAGADPTLLTTRAEKTADGWVLNGEKWFITNAGLADFFIVMAVSDPNANRHERASQFLVDAGTAGFTIVREIPSLDHHRADPRGEDLHYEVRLTDVHLPDDALLGPRGSGFRIAQERLGPGRIHHCMRWIGQASRALDMLCERATYRHIHGSVLAEKQTIQNWIADSWTELNAARLLTLQAAWKIDHEGVAAARTEISAIKFYVAKVLHDVIDRALQAHGALGYSDDLPLADMYRRARAARIYDGPDEVHRVVVARQVMKGYAPPPDGVPSEHVPTRERAVTTVRQS